MRLLLLLKVAAALSSDALPPSALYKPTETGDRALSWLAALGVFAKLVKRRPAAAVVAGLLTQPLAAGITRDLLRTPSLVEPETLLPDANSRIVDTDPLEGVRIVAYEGRGAATIHASHGFGANCLSFCDVLPLVARRGDVGSATAHDHPGFGLTRRPGKLAAYELKGDMASACLAPAALGVFVGHSMGSISAAEAALARATAGRPTALVLIDAAIFHLRDPPPTDARYAASRRRRGLAAVGRGAARLLRAPLASWPFRVMIRRLVAVSYTHLTLPTKA